MNKNILIVVDSIDVDDSSGSKANVALIQAFVGLQYNVTVLHYTQKDIKIQGADCVAVKEVRYSVNYVLSRCQRLLYRWFKYDVSKYIDGVFGFSFGFFNDCNSIKKVVKKYDPNAFDMVWTLSKGNSYRPHKALLDLPNWHSKWFAYVHDPYPQQLYPRPYNFVPYGYKKKRMFLREVTLKAKYLVFPSLLLKEWMESYYKAVHNKSLIVPHQMQNNETNVVGLPAYFFEDKFNVLHAGNLLDLRDPKPLVEAYRIFLEKVPEAKYNSALLFLGTPSVYQDYLNDMKQGLSSLYVSEDYVAFKTVYAMQMKASVNVILEAKSEISPFLPGKFPHCVATNKPIMLIGPYYSECKRLLGKEYPFAYDFEDVERMADGLVLLYRQWETVPESLSLNRTDLEHYLSPDYIKEIIQSVL